MGRESDIAAVPVYATEEEQLLVLRHICRRYQNGLLSPEDAKELLLMLGLVSPDWAWADLGEDKRQRMTPEQYVEWLGRRNRPPLAADPVEILSEYAEALREAVDNAIGRLHAGLPMVEL